MENVKISFEESVAKAIIKTSKCVGCGACVLACPFNCLGYIDEKPVLIRECEVCGVCARVCFQYEFPVQDVENLIFGRKRNADEIFGVYRRLVLARAVDNQILDVCQDGGVVTALLLFALENNLIEGAVVAKSDEKKPFFPHPAFVTRAEEVLQAAGTKYFYSPNILALAEAIEQKKKRIAFVGTPCHIRALRKMQMVGLNKYITPLRLLIGLACSGCFMYEGLMNGYLHRKLGIDLNRIKKINIKGRMLVTLENGTISIPLAEVKQFARKSCHSCIDFSSEFADISAGGLGLNGWTFIIIRTKSGEELFSAAEKAGAIITKDVIAELNALNLFIKLSRRKQLHREAASK